MRTIAPLFLIAALAPPALAQESPVPYETTEANCRRAVAESAAERATRPWLELLTRCGASGGAALAGELRRIGDLAGRDEMTRTFITISRLRDARMFEAALELAEDRSAALESRIAAFRLMIQYRDPFRTTNFRYFLLPGNSISGGTSTHRLRHAEGVPLPEGWEASARAVMVRVTEDSTEGEAARYAASQAVKLWDQIHR
jgi:hypothetical protein